MNKRRHILYLFILALIVLLVRVQFADTQPKFKILVSNDDGIDAPGIAALAEAMTPLGQVTVAAPSQNNSGVGHGITSDQPIFVRETDKNGIKWYAIDAKPATCVRLALEELLTEKPDLVVSGINRGENLGVVTFYSATAACAREAAFKGIPAIAFSLEHGKQMDYSAAAKFAEALVTKLKAQGFLRKSYLNVNIPCLPENQVKGVLITRQDVRTSIEYFEKRINPRGAVYFWSDYKTLDPGPEKTDVWAVRNGYISITPMMFDQTNAADLKPLDSLKKLKWKK